MIDVDLFVRDMLADAFTVVSAAQWRERAQMFLDARPRSGDFNGQQTVEQLRERWRRLTAIAQDCENHAQVLESRRQHFDELDVFGEAA